MATAKSTNAPTMIPAVTHPPCSNMPPSASSRLASLRSGVAGERDGAAVGAAVGPPVVGEVVGAAVVGGRLGATVVGDELAGEAVGLVVGETVGAAEVGAAVGAGVVGAGVVGRGVGGGGVGRGQHPYPPFIVAQVCAPHLKQQRHPHSLH